LTLLGAFYFFPNITKYYGKKTPEGVTIKSDEDLAIYILKAGAVVTIPGSKFQKPGYLRIAFASSPDERIRIGVEKMAEALQKLE
jgi:aspartate aminotransferase